MMEETYKERLYENDEEDLYLDELTHYGTPRHSGRYPWGSGENPYQRTGSFSSRVAQLKNEGLSETERAEALGMSTTELRARLAVDKSRKQAQDFVEATRLKEAGYSNAEIAKELGLSGESSVRSLLAKNPDQIKSKAENTADFLRQQVDEKGIIDISKGVDTELGVSQEVMRQAATILQDQGYVVYDISVPQATNPGKQTNIKIACPPDTTYYEAYQARDKGKIESIADYYHSPDGGETMDILQPPKSMDSKRIMVRYGDEGGKEMDGVIQIRRGVEDISLGNSHYAQVRIAVDDSMFMKGMAVYSDDLPDGYDVIFNTNKASGTPMASVLKPFKTDDPNNPFGSLIKANGQRWYIDEDGKRKLSVINKVREEGDWNEWDKTLSSQFLGKQNMKLIKNQLNLTYADKVAEYDELMSLTNPTVKRHLLKKFSDDCDAAAVHMKAAAFPRQRTQVILPITTLKDGEIYAPNYRNGEKVALIRYPHGGTFEIPVLTVNNKHKDGRKILGNSLDAVGINSRVADILSGADFDGDTVSVIPLGKVKIKASKPLDGVKNFDAKTKYPYVEGMQKMKRTNLEMGKISNLITDMTIAGATQSELARAVRHSMVVIDAEKHNLNYKQSEKDNNIQGLKKKYQMRVNDDGKVSFGAATLLSRKNQTVRVPERRGSVRIDPKTGEYIYKESGATYKDPKTGKTVQRFSKPYLVLETKDVRSLSSGTPQEEAYANYANQMKSLANQARKASVSTPRAAWNRSSTKTYSKEVSSLESKLNKALKHAPRERRAQIIANSKVNALLSDNPSLKSKDKSVKKFKQMAISDARKSVGIKPGDRLIDISDREWEAIQAGAISDSKVERILQNADLAKVRQQATPKTTTSLSAAKIAKIRAMSNTYTIAEIADSMGISSSTVSKYMKGV